MGKLITVMLPHVPEGFLKSLDKVRPPYLKGVASTLIGKGVGVYDLELTFESPPMPSILLANLANEAMAPVA